MAKVKFLIKNEKGQDVQKTSKEITTKDYRDYLILNEALSSDMSEVEKLDKQLEFIASLFEDLEVEIHGHGRYFCGICRHLLSSGG